MKCSVCGGTTFGGKPVLWQALVDAWQLTPIERAYVDRQQGEACLTCGANLRSIVLARAILGALVQPEPLAAFNTVDSPIAVLELNEAGSLTQYLRLFNHYTFGSYPAIDMHALPYASESFDLVVHSDTLEHVANPVHALAECHRVLRRGGILCYTVPIIVGRLTRSRAGLPKSFHGDLNSQSDDLVVHTEFGADAWLAPMESGFEEVRIHSVAFPAAIAMSAIRR